MTFSSLRPAPYLTCRLELKELLESFLQAVGQYNPCLALLHIPAVFDLERTCDISCLFPPQTTVVKCMDSLLGSSKGGVQSGPVLHVLVL